MGDRNCGLTSVYHRQDSRGKGKIIHRCYLPAGLLSQATTNSTKWCNIYPLISHKVWLIKYLTILYQLPKGFSIHQNNECKHTLLHVPKHQARDSWKNYLPWQDTKYKHTERFWNVYSLRISLQNSTQNLFLFIMENTCTSTDNNKIKNWGKGHFYSISRVQHLGQTHRIILWPLTYKITLHHKTENCNR